MRMLKRKLTNINDLELSRYLDGELSPRDFERVSDTVRGSQDHRRAVQRMQTVSSLVRQHVRIPLTPEEQQRFDLQLARRMREEPRPHPARFLDYLTPAARVWQWAWPWRMAAAMVLMLVCAVPFYLEFSSAPEKVFREPLVSDYSTKIYHESNSKAHYDMIWVITEEEEESDSSNPLGLFYFYRV